MAAAYLDETLLEVLAGADLVEAFFKGVVLSVIFGKPTQVLSRSISLLGCLGCDGFGRARIHHFQGRKQLHRFCAMEQLSRRSGYTRWRDSISVRHGSGPINIWRGSGFIVGILGGFWRVSGSINFGRASGFTVGF